MKYKSGGSSPRVWGIPDSWFISPKLGRFIPTRVGNTDTSTIFRGIIAVHPHACGEYCVCVRAHGICSGSSPRVWGIQALRAATAAHLRFIPTRVGNTLILNSLTQTRTVHPHACGEYSPPACTTPPPARFIPTRVGNTGTQAQGANAPSVHPHACGEYMASTPPIECVTGSSPRVWGILSQALSFNDVSRFIPTRVGNTQ